MPKCTLSYQEVANIANLLTSEGKRVTLEYVRRALGRGTHAQIALFLSKWQQQHSKKRKNKYNKLSCDSFSSKYLHNYNKLKGNGNLKSNFQQSIDYSRTKTQYHNKDRNLKTSCSNVVHSSSIKKNNFCQEFDSKNISLNLPVSSNTKFLKPSLFFSRFNQECKIVKNLFFALYQVKSIRLNLLESQRKIQNQLFFLKIKRESLIMQLKKQNHMTIYSLLSEFNKIQANSSRKLHDLRQQLRLN